MIILQKIVLVPFWEIAYFSFFLMILLLSYLLLSYFLDAFIYVCDLVLLFDIH